MGEWKREPQTADDVISQISEAIVTTNGWPAPIYRDPATKRVLSVADSVAATPATVLLSGESGVGKEVFARYIHARSPRYSGPFVAINCAAVPENLLESEFFGHERGAFSGAVKQHQGVFEQANQGTLLLDEVSEMPLDLQAKLLRVLQERKIRRVGGTKDLAVDVRVIATTNRDLLQYVEEGGFRRDLYYRLSVFPLAIPPLRDRPKDIEVLVRHYVSTFAEAFGKDVRGVTAAAMKQLREHPFPGNVRELVNVVQRGIILCGDAKEIDVDHLIFETTDEFLEQMSEFGTEESELSEAELMSFKVGRQPLTEIRRIVILETLKHYQGNRSRAAEALGLSTRTIRNKLREYREKGGETPDS